MVLEAQKSCILDPNATYLLTGGFGGLGRSILKWMADRGAKYMLVLSRSGAKSLAAKAVLADMTARGVKVICPPCDIANAAEVKKIIDNCKLVIPPIKGCIHGAMVLKVRIALLD